MNRKLLPRAATITLIMPRPPRTRLRSLPAVLFLAAAGFLMLRSHVYFGPKHILLHTLPLTDLNGIPVPPATVQNKAILLNFWAPWCGPCRREFPTLNRLQQQHPEALVIGVEDDPDQYQQAQVLARLSPLNYLLLRTTPALHSTFGDVTMLPTTLYITPSGKVLHTVSGVIPERLMRHYFDEAIATP